MQADAAVIVRRAADGDEQAFSALHDRYQGLVFKAIRRRHGVDPEDVAQRVWSEVHRRLRDYDPDRASFGGWLSVIATRKAITEANRHQRHSERIKRLAEITATGGSNPFDPPDGRLRAEELLEAITKCAGKLRGRAREILRLRRFDKLSTEQIAGQCGISLSRVRAAVCEASRKMLECLRRAGFM